MSWEPGEVGREWLEHGVGEVLSRLEGRTGTVGVARVGGGCVGEVGRLGVLVRELREAGTSAA